MEKLQREQKDIAEETESKFKPLPDDLADIKKAMDEDIASNLGKMGALIEILQKEDIPSLVPD
eukprot:6055939-Lingulodinium_polyedra.AAC.1